MWFAGRGCEIPSQARPLRGRLLLLTRSRHPMEWFQCFSKYRKLQGPRFMKTFLLKVSSSLKASSASFPRTECTSSPQGSCRSVTAMTNEEVLVELAGGQHSLFLQSLLFWS